MLTAALLWMAFPPVGWWWLGWLAPIPLIWMIAIPDSPQASNGKDSVASDSFERSLDRTDSLPIANPNGSHRRRHYAMLYLSGLAYWLGTFYFIPFPHPALWLGWLAISLYMAIYTPLFVGAGRLLVHHYRMPVLIAAPLAFTGLEWFRSNFATGMPMVCLSHSQYRQPSLIQVADLSGL